MSMMSKMEKSRFMMDCRTMPDSVCTLAMTGSMSELMKAGMEHAVSSHGYKDTPAVRRALREMLVPADD